MNKFVIAFLIFLTAPVLRAQNFELPLWNGNIPNAKKSTLKEVRDTDNIVWIKHVINPDMAVYLPSIRNATGQAVVIYPGGGYVVLAYDWEGSDIAKWLNANGVAAIVVKYRLPDAASNVVPYESPLMDAQRAVRITRYNAKKWHIDPNKIGIMGFSAGGNLAANVGTHFDEGIATSDDPIQKISCRPDFMALLYPVISMKKGITHMGSRNALLGKNPSPELVNRFSAEMNVDSTTPPTFLVQAADDNLVPVENSIVFFEALKKNNIPVEMHIFPKGGHGFGLGLQSPSLHQWTGLFIQWLSGLDGKN